LAIGYRLPQTTHSLRCLLAFFFSFFLSASRNLKQYDAKLTLTEGLMRDLFLIMGIIATVAIPGMGQDASDTGRIAIRKVLEEQQAAWNRQDLEGFMAGYWNTPELTFFSGAHESKGWHAALDRYKKTYQGAGRGFSPQLISEIVELATEGLKPELTLLFDLSVEDCNTRTKRRTKGKEQSDRLRASTLGYDQRSRVAGSAEGWAAGAAGYENLIDEFCQFRLYDLGIVYRHIGVHCRDHSGRKAGRAAHFLHGQRNYRRRRRVCYLPDKEDVRAHQSWLDGRYSCVDSIAAACEVDMDGFTERCDRIGRRLEACYVFKSGLHDALADFSRILVGDHMIIAEDELIEA